MSTIGFDHRLYQVGRPADFTYSDMARLGTVSSAHPHDRGVTRVAVCLAIATLGYLVLVRGTDAGWARERTPAGAAMAERRRRRRSGASASPRSRLAGSSSTMPTLLNAYTEVRTRRAAREGVRAAVQAARSRCRSRGSSRVSLRHDYFPERRAAAWHGTLRAVNRNARPVDTLFISLRATGPTPTGQFEAASSTGLALDSLAFDRDGIADHATTCPNGVRLYRSRETARAGRVADGSLCRTLRAARLPERRVQQRCRRTTARS